ncbi:unnamed protein product [Pieris macdunnoughi]|uniref:Uncharacterized protein n=1 Tax=Pieris macdunnoughi TaxID=345717 RepID=A0A821SA84_9NEOP|nr:unnamed protein product [Pieris macdunnoughi]
MSLTIIFLACCVIAANAGTTQIKRDLTALGLMGEDDQEDSLMSIISFVKTQIKTFIEDLLWEAFKCIRTMILTFKRKVFKKLKNYTISDIFNFFFEGIFEFVSDEDSGLEEHHHAKMVPLEPAWLPHNSTADPYIINRLIHSGET